MSYRYKNKRNEEKAKSANAFLEESRILCHVADISSLDIFSCDLNSSAHEKAFLSKIKIARHVLERKDNQETKGCNSPAQKRNSVIGQ